MYGLFVRFREWSQGFPWLRRVLLIAMAIAFLLGFARAQWALLFP